MFQVRQGDNVHGEAETATVAQAATAILGSFTSAQKAALLGLTEYEDLTAANVALAPGVAFWNTDLDKLDFATA